MADALIAEGNQLLVSGDLLGARKAYTAAVAADPASAVALQKRASTNNQLGFHADALGDAEGALRLSPSSPALAEYNAGIALFQLGRKPLARAAFDRALAAFEEGVGASPANLGETLRSWLARCEAVQEEGGGAPAARKPTAAAGPPPKPKARYEWYQTTTHVTLSFLVRDADGSRSSVTVGEGGASLSVSLALPASDWVLDLDLYDAVVRGEQGQPDAVSIRPSKVEVRIAKAAGAAYMWPALEAVAGAGATVSADAAKAKAGSAAAAPPPHPTPAVPQPVPAGGASAAALTTEASAPKKKGKDWAAVEKELDAEEAADPQGEEALMKLFRQIYKDGNEETRKAMTKSFQTSGGTVLSTNWKEVATSDYEKNVQPPAGMEAKKWES